LASILPYLLTIRIPYLFEIINKNSPSSPKAKWKINIIPFSKRGLWCTCRSKPVEDEHMGSHLKDELLEIHITDNSRIRMYPVQ
jgi:hypothetical protein